MSQTDILLPTTEDARLRFAAALDARHARVREAMLRLRAAPPQVLLLESGLEAERLSMALWYAALLNCPAEKAPCLTCNTCLQIGAQIFADVHVFDGQASSIKIEEVRELRALIAEAPRHGRLRVVVFAEAQALSVQAANALLKSLEEPRPGTVFLLLAPQRERLLPTLVSRGWILTLAWPDVAAPLPDAMRPWVDALAGFLRTGQGWFERTATKGAVDHATARHVVLSIQKAVSGVASGRGAGELGLHLDTLPPQARLNVCDLLANAQEALDLSLNPALVLDNLATHLFLVCHGK